MKQYVMVGMLICFSLTLMSCAINRNPHLNIDLSRETWQGCVETNPARWKIGADRWFLTGDPNGAEIANRRAPCSAALSTMQVKVPNFFNIMVEGNFQVQIFGTYAHNSLYVQGPNRAVREVIIEIKNGTLCLRQLRKGAPYMGQVIIRIGVCQLANLVQMGCGSIEAVSLNSRCLSITSTRNASGNIFLSGLMNVRSITNYGWGSINVFGANTPALAISTFGSGAVNICGRVGIRSITHRGRANINIIGADSCGLTINACGSGKIGISGRVNLREVKANDNVEVYATSVESDCLYAYLRNCARVGLAGIARDLYVDAFNQSRFEGRFLCATSAFVRARDCAHINVTACNKIFASSTQNSSVYFFGSPNYLSQFVTGNGLVIPIFGPAARSCMPQMPVSFKGEVEGPAPCLNPGPSRVPCPATLHPGKRPLCGEG